jgi:hypothetical protein
MRRIAWSLADNYDALHEDLAQRFERRSARAARDALGHDVVLLDLEPPPGRMPRNYEEERRQRLGDFARWYDGHEAARKALAELDRFALSRELLYLGYQTRRCAAVAGERISAERNAYRLFAPESKLIGSVSTVQEILRRNAAAAEMAESLYNRRDADRLRPGRELLVGLAALGSYIELVRSGPLHPPVLGAPGGPAAANALAEGSALGMLAELALALVDGELTEDGTFAIVGRAAGELLERPRPWGASAVRHHLRRFRSLRGRVQN